MDRHALPGASCAPALFPLSKCHALWFLFFTALACPHRAVVRVVCCAKEAALRVGHGAKVIVDEVGALDVFALALVDVRVGWWLDEAPDACVELALRTCVGVVDEVKDECVRFVPATGAGEGRAA